MTVEWRVGDVRITKVEESAPRYGIGRVIPQIEAATLERHAHRFTPEQLDEEGKTVLMMCGFVVESRGRRILVDTCVGPEHPSGDPDSPFLRRLAAAGFPPDTIDAVVCTHFHYDHVGWNTVLDGGVRRPTFGRAEYVFSEPGWTGLREVDREATAFGSVATGVTWVVEAGLASLVAPEHRLDDQVSLMSTPGHAPGHVSVLVQSGGASALITGDCFHHPIQLLDSGLATVTDHDPRQAAASREKVVDWAVDTDAVLIGSHFATPHAFRLEDRPDGLELLPAPGSVSVGAASTPVEAQSRPGAGSRPNGPAGS